MHVKILRSPDRKKKFRAILGDGRTVDFGASEYSDYTKHKNPSRMRSYVLRHGGQIPKRVVAEREPAMIHRMMRNIDKSDREDWKLSGIGGAGSGRGGISGVSQQFQRYNGSCQKIWN